MQAYPAAGKEREVKLAVEAGHPVAQTARDLGVHEHTLHTGLGTSHRAARQAPHVHDAPLDAARQRLRHDTARCKEERAIVKTAAADCAPPLP